MDLPPAAVFMPSYWQILALDLDGTLIGWNHKINQRDLDGVGRAQAVGIHVAICTGRNSIECAGILGALSATTPLSGLGVFVNGGMVASMEDGRAIHSTCLSDDLAREAIDFFGGRGHAVLVLADDPASRLPVYCLTDHGPPHHGTTQWLTYNRMNAPVVEEPPAGFRGRIVRVGSVVNVSHAADLHRDLRGQFGTRCATHSIYSPHYDCQVVELFHPVVNKWSGLQQLAAAMNISDQRIVAVGDDVNDVAMLQNAALSFAMTGSTPPALAAAKRVTGSHENCGVAQVIDELLSGALEP